MRIFRPCLIARWIYPGAIFRISTNEKIICLTFDDGPDPSSTPVLLDILERYKVKALFFCNGSRAENYPGLVDRIIKQGHITGNHTYSHKRGWTSSVKSYLEDVEKASAKTSDKWFRPPFGQIRLLQYYRLKKKYRIFFWDIMPYDFDDSFAPEDSLGVLLEKIRPGSVIVLHDKEQSTSAAFLDRFLKEVTERGYRFVIPDSTSGSVQLW
jgi:peptidoglycan/xylan/chitin deacetylase (PgdA/CDA1 family)